MEGDTLGDNYGGQERSWRPHSAQLAPARRVGGGAQFEVSEADLDAARCGRFRGRQGGAEEADREEHEGAKVMTRCAC